MPRTCALSSEPSLLSVEPTYLKIDVAAPGAITTPAHTLYDIVRKLPEGSQVELEYRGGEQRLTLSAGRSRFVLACLPREDFPVMAEDALPHRFNLPVGDLKKLIDKTRFAISTEETRFYLNGIYLHVADGKEPMLVGVATDGHRLARVRLPMPMGAAGMPGVIVPRKTVQEVRKLLDEAEGTVQVSLSDSKIRFDFADAVLTSKLIDGTFPDYERVIPSGNDKILEVPCKAFASAVDRVSTISTEKSRAVKVVLAKGKAVLSASSAENASATEELAVGYESSDLEIGFNARYLIEILGEIDGESAEFVFADAVSPTIVRDATDPGALYVLMPMRV